MVTGAPQTNLRGPARRVRRPAYCGRSSLSDVPPAPVELWRLRCVTREPSSPLQSSPPAVRRPGGPTRPDNRAATDARGAQHRIRGALAPRVALGRKGRRTGIRRHRRTAPSATPCSACGAAAGPGVILDPSGYIVTNLARDRGRAARPGARGHARPTTAAHVDSSGREVSRWMRRLSASTARPIWPC